MTEKIWKHTKCGCVVWMNDDPEDKTQLIEFKFDESKCTGVKK